jgi:8-oxo-dGTP pyrophosphatase MutT (NUDIX family)
MQRPEFRVTCKAAIYDPTRQFVLVASYTPTKNGLPGGHLEPGELPDEAMKRELREEIGFVPSDLERKDFWVHSDGKVILGYVASASKDQAFTIDSIELRSIDWTSLDSIRSGEVEVESYDEFVLKWA